jgi:hypothetical protein
VLIVLEYRGSEEVMVLVEYPRRTHVRLHVAVIISLSLIGQTARGEESAPASMTTPTAEATSIADEPLEAGHSGPSRTMDDEHQLIPTGMRRALLLCGHPGNAEYRRMYTEVVRDLRRGLIEHWDFPADEIVVLSGTRDEALAHGGQHAGPATRERIRTAIDELAGRLAPQDTFWVFVVGHAHFDGRRTFFNLPGPDLDTDEFGAWFQGVACREQVFFITTALSGYAIRSLSRKGRVIITATEADQEVNETIYPIMLALTLSEPPALHALDQDRDGRLTLLDLHLTVSRRVLETYARSGNIPTEHAQLDDNGDGRGTEVQWDYLDPSLGGRGGRGPQPRIPAGADGAWAATIQFNLTRPPVMPDASPDDRSRANGLTRE